MLNLHHILQPKNASPPSSHKNSFHSSVKMRAASAMYYAWHKCAYKVFDLLRNGQNLKLIAARGLRQKEQIFFTIKYKNMLCVSKIFCFFLGCKKTLWYKSNLLLFQGLLNSQRTIKEKKVNYIDSPQSICFFL